MGRLLLLLLGIALYCPSRAQVDTLWRPGRMLTINTIALVDPFGPSSLRIGYEQRLSSHFSMAVEASGYYQYLPFTTYKEEHLQGVGGRFSTILWLRRSSAYANGISLDLLYKRTAGTVVDSIKIDGVEPYRLAYGLDREVAIVRVCKVEQWHWTRRIWVELYFGLGARFKHSSSSGITQEEVEARDFSAGEDNDNVIVPAMHDVGSIVQPDIVFGIRLALAPR